MTAAIESPTGLSDSKKDTWMVALTSSLLISINSYTESPTGLSDSTTEDMLAY